MKACFTFRVADYESVKLLIGLSGAVAFNDDKLRSLCKACSRAVDMTYPHSYVMCFGSREMLLANEILLTAACGRTMNVVQITTKKTAGG